MQTFSSLNSPSIINYTDLRTPGIQTDIPRAFDRDFTETTKTFDVYNQINITEVIRPDIALVRYKINVSDDTAITVDWGTLPSGVSVNKVGSIYTLSGIDSAEIWEQVKNPTVTVDDDFFGNVSYSAAIVFNDGTEDTEIEWNVGLYVPVAQLDAVFAQLVDGTKIIFGTAEIQALGSILTVADVLELIEYQADIVAEFEVSVQPEVFATPGITNLDSNFTITADLSEVVLPVVSINEVGELAISDNYFAIAQSAQTKIYSRANNSVIQTITGYTGSVDLAVTLSDSYTAIGNSSFNSNTGRVWIYNTTNGNLLYTLDGPNPQLGDRFGFSLGISGNNLIVGAAQKDDSVTDEGKAYVYDMSNGNLLHTINNPNPQLGDRFGSSVDNDGILNVIGATYDDDSFVDEGKAYIYSTDVLNATLTNPNPSSSDLFGFDVAILNNKAIVGAPFDDLSGEINTGSAYVFDATNGNLLLTFTSPEPILDDNDQFGRIVEISNDYAFVGAENKATGNGGLSGAVYIYDLTNGNLVYAIIGTSAASSLGSSLAVQGNTLITRNTDTTFVYDLTVL